MRKSLQRALAAAAVAVLSTTAAFAQRVEVNPYAGGFFSTNFANNQSLKKEGFYGARGGYFLTSNIEVEGNLGYINHFEFENAGHKRTRAWLWDGNATYHFASHLGKLSPYATIGAGGLTLNTVDADQAVLPIGQTGLSVLVRNKGSFFTVNYGGGVKGVHLWGPLGFRADVRARTLPNFGGSSITWLEPTGGVLLSWGER